MNVVSSVETLLKGEKISKYVFFIFYFFLSKHVHSSKKNTIARRRFKEFLGKKEEKKNENIMYVTYKIIISDRYLISVI